MKTVYPLQTKFAGGIKQTKFEGGINKVCGGYNNFQVCNLILGPENVT